MPMQSKVALAIMIFLFQSGLSTAATGLPVAGWLPQEFYVEANQAASESPFHREFYPLGEGAHNWTERIVMNELEWSAGATPQTLLEELARNLKESCADYQEYRYPLPPELASNTGLLMWHCGQDSNTNRGIVGSMKVVLGNDKAFVVTATGNYEPYEKGKTPLLKTQLERWTKFLASFEACDVLTHAGCWPDPNVLANAPAAPLTPEEQALVSLAEARGIALYLRDQFAWHATDYVVENNLLGKRAKGGKFLAVANPDGTGHVYFVQKRKALRVDMDENFRPTGSEWEKKVPDSIVAPLKALNTAVKEVEGVCGETVNNVVLPAEEGNGWMVYLLGATTQPELMIIGRHKRIGVNTEGTKVTSNDVSTRGCLVIQIDSENGNQETGVKWMGPLVSHLVSQVPWETHVFQSLTFDTPIFVVTEHAAWHVQGGRIIKIQL